MRSFRRAMRSVILLCILLAAAGLARAQAISETVAPLLEKPVQPTAVTTYQLQTYMMKHIAKPVAPATAEQWTAEAQRLRKRILEDIAFHGWPQEWVNSAPRFEQTM